MQTDNPTLATKGEDESLIWEFTLTADQQIKSDLFNFVQWYKFYQSLSDYDSITGKTISKLFGSIAYKEPMTPYITVDRNHQATLLINNVRRKNEGTYKIEYGVRLDGTLLACQEFNVSVLGKVLYVRGFCSFTPVINWVSWTHSGFKLRKNDPVLKLGIEKYNE